MAECFLKESGVRTFTVRKDRSDGAFLDIIKQTFEHAAKEEPAVILLDDLDKFANEDASVGNSDEMIAVQSGIDSCKEHDVLVIGTANDIDMIPDSLMRAGRLSRRIMVPIPSETEVREIVGYYMAGKQYAEVLDEGTVADLLDGSSCALLETVINDAGLYAGYAGRETVTLQDVIKSFSAIAYQKLSANEEDERSIKNTDSGGRLSVAYHEAGHIVVSEVLCPGSVKYAYLSENGVHTGITGYAIGTARRAMFSFKNNEVIICRALGGKAATEIKTGYPDMGCKRDIEKAYDIISDMVDDLAGYGFDKHVTYASADSTRTRKQDAVANELARYYAMAKKIIMDNFELLEQVAQKLLQKGYLVRNDLIQMREQVAGNQV